MRKLLVLFVFCFPLVLVAQEYEYTFSLFTNSSMPENWFYSKAESSGVSAIKASEGRLPVCDSVFHTPGNSLELQYRNGAEGHWEAKVYSGSLRGMDHFKEPAILSIWVFSPGDKIPVTDLPVVQFMQMDSTLSDQFRMPSLKPGEWTRVIIPLDLGGKFTRDLTANLLAVVLCQPPKRSGDRTYTLYLDDLELLPGDPPEPVTKVPAITSVTGFAMHADITWEEVDDPAIHLVKIYRSENGREFLPVGVQRPYISRYADYIGVTGKNVSYRISYLNSGHAETGLSSAVATSTKSMSDDELLTMVQEASFRYYWEGAEKKSGMARENIPGRHNMIATGASGFGIMALIVGTERNFITREESAGRFLKILDYLERAERFHGVYPHFMDGPSGKVEPFFGNRDNGADLVETSFLLEGLLTARRYFDRDNDPERLIRARITAIWEKTEFAWFRRTPGSPYLYWHWSPDQEWVIDHPLIGWNETMVVYLLAIASPTHSVPAEMYYSGWAGQDERAQKYRKNWGQSDDGAMYGNGNSYFGHRLDVGVNNGGPLFFTHYSYLGYDPHLITDRYTNYFTNNCQIASINHCYCLVNPKDYEGYSDSGWGLTASDGPYGYSADEPVEWQDHGKLTPTGAISSFPYTPEESMKALKNYYYNCGSFLWGEYGFKDAFSLSENWCSEIYMGLNQAPMVVMIENYRTGLIWKLFMKNPEISEGLKKIEMIE